MLNSIKSKQGKILIEEEEVKKREAEYVEDLYKDDSRGEVDLGDLLYEAEAITRKEIESVIKQLPKGKACGKDNIAAELLQGMGDKGMDNNKFDKQDLQVRVHSRRFQKKYICTVAKSK